METNKKPPTAVQILAEQKSRVATLQDRRTRVQVRVETDRAALAAAQAESVEAFKTHDLNTLREMFRTRGANNDRLVMEYLMEVDSVESQLTDIERQVKL